jgi:hypothetical protein
MLKAEPVVPVARLILEDAVLASDLILAASTRAFLFFVVSNVSRAERVVAEELAALFLDLASSAELTMISRALRA